MLNDNQKALIGFNGGEKIMGSKSKLLNNLLSLSAVQIAHYGLPLISIPVISRIIGPEKFGVLNFAAAFIVGFDLVISYGFDLTATRKIAKDPENERNRNKVFTEVVYTRFLLFVLASTIFLVLLFTVPELKSEKPVLIFSYLGCVGTLLNQNWIFQAMQDLSTVVKITIVGKLLFTITILLVVDNESDYVWQPLLISLIHIAATCIIFIWALKRYRLKFVEVSLKRCVQVLVEGKATFLSLVIMNSSSTINIFILRLYQDAEQVGYFTAGQRLTLIAQSVLTIPLTQALYPYVGKAFNESRERGLIVTQKLIPCVIFLTIVIALMMIMLGPFIVNLFYGHKFDPAIIVFQASAFIPLFIGLNNILGIQVMLNLNMDRTYFKIITGGAALSLLLNLLLVDKTGYIGTVICWSLSEIIIVTSMYIALKQNGINIIKSSYFKLSALYTLFRPLQKGYLFKR